MTRMRMEVMKEQDAFCLGLLHNEFCIAVFNNEIPIC